MDELEKFMKEIFDEEKQEISGVYFGEGYESAKRSLVSNIIDGWRPTKKDILKYQEILELTEEEAIKKIVEYVNE